MPGTPFLAAIAERLGPSGWAVDLEGVPSGWILVAWPWGRDARALRFWEEGDSACARLERTDRVAPPEEYLDPVRREAMARSLLGSLAGPDEALSGFAAGHMARLLGDDDMARWAYIGGEASRLHREAVETADASLSLGHLAIDGDGWVYATVRLPLPVEGLDEETFNALLRGVLEVEARYGAHLRAALFGGFGLARQVSRESDGV